MVLRYLVPPLVAFPVKHAVTERSHFSERCARCPESPCNLPVFNNKLRFLMEKNFLSGLPVFFGAGVALFKK